MTNSAQPTSEIQRAVKPMEAAPVIQGPGNLSVDIQVSGQEFDNPSDDDFRIRVSEVNSDGPVILIYKYKTKDVPIHDEMLSLFLMRCLIRLGTKFEVNQIYHVRVKIMDMNSISNVLA